MTSPRLRAFARLALVAALLACAGPRRQASTPPAQAPGTLVPIRLLAINDLHGQLEASPDVEGMPAPGAAALATTLRAARAGAEGATLLVSAGDLIGASPAVPALLQDEPTISILNGLANAWCRPEPGPGVQPLAALAADPRCDVVATIGNHELDEGWDELVRLWGGGTHTRGPFLDRPWRGARFPLVSANVIDRTTGGPALPPFVVRELAGVRVGVIGAVTSDLPNLVNPLGIERLEVRPVAEAVNGAARALGAQGVRTIVLLLHDGGLAETYDGPTRAGADAPPELRALVALLDGEVDVVVSAHAHRFTNAIVPNAGGRPVLVTQAFSAGRAYARIDLEVDRATGDVVGRRAEVIRVPGVPPGAVADASVAAQVAEARALVAPRLERPLGASVARQIRRGSRPPGPDETYESALGDLVADACRAKLGAEVALVNAGGLRADLPAGPLQWGHLYAVLPFGNALVTLALTGAELREALEQQWKGQREPRALAVSGLTYTWDPSAEPGRRVIQVTVGGAPLDPGRRYAVAVPIFLAGGGDGFKALVAAGRAADRSGPLDVDALEDWVKGRTAPLEPALDGRIARAR